MNQDRTRGTAYGPGSPSRQSLRRYLPEATWSSLVACGVVNHFRAGETLLREGERGGSLLLIAAGRVMVMSEPDGSGLLLALRGAGDLVGEMAVARKSRSATVLALDRCIAYRILDRTFREALATHRSEAAYTDYIVGKLSETVPYQARLAQVPPRQRLACLLAEIVALAGPELSDPLRVPCSQVRIASALGVSRSTVAHHLSKLRTSNILAPGPRLIIADLIGLHREAGLTD